MFFIDQVRVVRKVDNTIQRYHSKCNSLAWVVRKDGAIQWIAWFVLLTLTRWIVIYPVDSVIQPLNNWGQLLSVYYFSRDKTGKFPDYPDDSEGGSAAIFKEKDPLEVILNFCNIVIPIFLGLILIKT